MMSIRRFQLILKGIRALSGKAFQSIAVFKKEEME